MIEDRLRTPVPEIDAYTSRASGRVTSSRVSMKMNSSIRVS